ncbi:MAG TPA: cytochrome C oxidase subunit IV family protein [Mycobacterium sp.]|uniref:cytochrome C oxidase subunit IV family protein n=1 Tax=Mycobacterium sp. TaxID=1785 RepID=UPI002C2589B6|nr:cytochrome C oxidase subunit IV family protein [Mycobacterium sp.]HME77365.1 cytochrome C oxidase subunit IV family protein [Mycobacterium sp.]
MHIAFNRRLLLVWVVLASLTLAYLWIDHSASQHGLPSPSAFVTSSIIVIALVKVRIIFREFMEVRHAPVLLCRLTDTWLVIIAVGLLGSYFVGLATA